MNNESRNKTPLRIAILGFAALVIGLASWFYLIKPNSDMPMPPEVANAYIPEGRPVVGLQLIDHNNQPFSEQRFKGKWSFLFFGFTHCPDVCPTTLLVMKSVLAKLPEIAKQAPEPQLLFVSVDPDRDTPAIMKAYTEHYHPDFIGLTGEHKYLDILTIQVGALYGYEDGDTEKEYTVNHSAQMVLIDPQGHFRAVFTTPHQVDSIVNTFTAIRQYHRTKNAKNNK